MKTPGDEPFFDIESEESEPSTPKKRIEKQFRSRRAQAGNHVRAHHARAKRNWAASSSTGSRWESESVQRFGADAVRSSRYDTNEIEPHLEAISGREATAKTIETVKSPDSDLDSLAEVCNRYIAQELENANSSTHDSDGFYSLLVGGIQAMWVRKEDSSRIPRTKVRVLDLNEVWWDHEAKERNLADRKWHAYVTTWTVKEVKKRWPKWEREQGLGREAWATIGAGGESNARFVVTGRGLTPQNRAEVAYYEWVEEEEYYELAFPQLAPELEELVQPDTLAGELYQRWMIESQMGGSGLPPKWREITREELDRASEEWALANTGVGLEEFLYVGKHDVYRYAWLVDGKMQAHGEIPEQAFTILFMAAACRKDGETRVWTSRVDALLPKNQLLNSVTSMMVQALGLRSKATSIAIPGVFVDNNDALVQLSSLGGVVAVTSTDESQFKPVPVPTLPDFNPLLELASAGMSLATGENPLSTGGVQDLRRTSSKTVAAAQAAGSARAARFFDALAGYREERGRLLVRQMWAYHKDDPSELAEIVGPQVAPLIPPDPQDWLDALRMQIRVIERPLEDSAEARANTTEALLNSQLLPQLVQLGYPPPPLEMIIELFLGETMPEKYKQMWLAKAAEQAAMAAQQQPPGEAPPEAAQ